MKKLSLFIKLAIALGAMGLLIYFNRLDVSMFRNLGEGWPWLVAAVAIWLPTYALVSLRFYEVLRMQDCPVSFKQALRWTMIGSFFDLCMPSSSGGDIVKAGYVVKAMGAGNRMRGIMAVTFDRGIGLLALFLMAWLACGPAWGELSQMPNGRLLVLVLTLICVGSLAVLRLLGSRAIRNNGSVESFVTGLPLGDKLWALAGTFHAMREQRGRFWAVVLLSCGNHLLACVALYGICRALGMDVDFLKGLVVFPLAIFSNVFGVAGGFGLGTLGFDFLFAHLFHIPGGASVGLAFQILTAATRLIGLPFFLWHNNASADPSPPNLENDTITA